MGKILEENKQLVLVKTREFQDTLQDRIGKFINDLDFYKRKVDQLEDNGNVEEIDNYKHTADSLDKRFFCFSSRKHLFIILHFQVDSGDDENR